MGILGIRNRTENWETARELVPLLKNKRKLSAFVSELGETYETDSESLELELFWRGMRDYWYGTKDKRSESNFQRMLVREYKEQFHDLRDNVEKFKGFHELKPHNYRVDSVTDKNKLKDNLVNTEIDIVIQTPECLYIGEAKLKSDFGSDGSHVLVHQLLRQYVMANILVELTDSGVEVVPFILYENENTLRKDQVLFMLEQGYLLLENILSWEDLKKIG